MPVRSSPPPVCATRGLLACPLSDVLKTSRARGQPDWTCRHRIRLPLQLQPPPAPRIPTIPLPNVWGGQIVLVPHREPFPIDLLGNLDLELLTRAIGNHYIQPHSTIRVLAPDRCLLHIISGDAPTTPISFIRRLRRLMRAPLSLHVYRSELPPETQQAVRSYFLSHSGSNGRRLWQDFLNGHRHPQGPTGEVLLQGHFFLWGFRQDGHDCWVVHVEAPQHRAIHPPPLHYSY
ncbi:hypothetical protein DFH06DRAFT_1189741 [Mycena polygramma]|nr:hypothetical protein DFH06DRAFT_1189741 [Mycena polygramma]